MPDGQTTAYQDIVFAWKPVVEGDIGHVEEYQDGVKTITYGPMPAVAVGPFIDECKERLRAIFTRLYGE